MQPNSASTPNGRKRKNLLRRALHRVAKFFGRHTAQKVATQVDLLPAAQDFFAVNSPVDVLPSLEIIVPLAVANDISPDGNAVETHAAELEDQFPHALGGIAENAIKAYNCGSSSNAPVGRSNTDQSIKETGGIQRNISTAFQFVMAAYGCNNFENVPAAEECLPLVEEISKLPDILAAERLDHDTKKECDHISKPEDIFERISPFSASGSEKLPDGDRESVVPDATILANTEIAEFADTAEVESDASDVRLIQRHVKMSVLKFEMGENQVSQKAESVSEDSQLNAENESVMQVDSALANTYIAGKADATGIECGTDSVPLTGQLIFQDIADTEEIESGSAEVQLMTIQQNFAKVVSNLIGGNEFSLTSPHIELIGTLSRSSFFKRHVSLARDKTTGYFRALKTYSKSALWSTEQGSQVLCDELASLRLVTEHWVPFCAKILGSFQTDSFICIVLPLYEGGCIVNHYRDMRFTHDQAKFYLAELALAIKALHDISILHRYLMR